MKKTFHDIFLSKEIIEDVSAKVTKEKRNFDEILTERAFSGANEGLFTVTRNSKQWDLAENI